MNGTDAEHPDWLEKLRSLLDKPEGAWWRDVLNDRELFLAARPDRLDIYHRGGLIFSVGDNGIPQTHIKYLVRNVQASASLERGEFKYKQEIGWRKYEPEKTIKEIKAAAGALAGPEKIGLHELLKNSSDVVDLEIVPPVAPTSADEESAVDEASEENEETAEAIDIAASNSDAPIAEEESARSGSDARHSGRRQHKLNRLDVATLELQDGAIRLVFHEAKHFDNKDLRAKRDRDPWVFDQITRYECTLRKQGPRLKEKYAEVCRSLVAIHAMRPAAPEKGEKLDLIRRVANREPFELDDKPRLIVFGFNKDQADGEIWRPHRARLVKFLGCRRFRDIGSTKGARI